MTGSSEPPPTLMGPRPSRPDVPALGPRQNGPRPPALPVSNHALMELPIRSYQGRIALVPKQISAKEAVDSLLREEVVGFDTESRPSFQKGENYPVSLVQFGGSDTVFLFQLELLGEDSKELVRLLSSQQVRKVGIAIRDDVRKLQNLMKFAPAGFVEVSEHTRRAGILNCGLRALVGHYLGFRVSKSAQTSNWARKDLDQKQVTYAATDAWSCRELYLHLQRQGLISH